MSRGKFLKWKIKSVIYSQVVNYMSSASGLNTEYVRTGIGCFRRQCAILHFSIILFYTSGQMYLLKLHCYSYTSRVYLWFHFKYTNKPSFSLMIQTQFIHWHYFHYFLLLLFTVLAADMLPITLIFPPLSGMAFWPAE